jgi:hypothetical protein
VLCAPCEIKMEETMIDDRMWAIVQKRLHYNDDEIKIFKNNPRNETIVSRGEEQNFVFGECATSACSGLATTFLGWHWKNNQV